MGNAQAKEEEEEADPAAIIGIPKSGAGAVGGEVVGGGQPVAVMTSSVVVVPDSRRHHQQSSSSRQPLFVFPPEFSMSPSRSSASPSFFHQTSHGEPRGPVHVPSEKGIPTLITWSHGGNNVAVEGSWDNWKSRRILHRSGKDHSLLLVLPSGIYHYKFIVDGECRYMPDLPCASDDLGLVCNILDVHDYVPECLDSTAEFEAPQSPDSSYGQDFPREEEFGKEPVVVPPQVEVTLLGVADSGTASCKHPQHVVLNHLFEDKGWRSQSVVALGLTHRFQSKYVTVVLYKPLKR